MLNKVAVILIIFSTQLYAMDDQGLENMYDRGNLTEQDVREQKLRKQLNITSGNQRKIRDIASKIKQVKVYHFINEALEIKN